MGCAAAALVEKKKPLLVCHGNSFGTALQPAANGRPDQIGSDRAAAAARPGVDRSVGRAGMTAPLGAMPPYYYS